MNCVACKDPMVVLELNQVEVDHCLSCGGVWLDAGELELLLEDPEEVKQMLSNFAANRELQQSKRKCPICLKKMETFSVGVQKKVQLDRCRFHHGLWFDRGELTTVLEIFDTDRHSRVLALLKEIFEE